MGESPRWHDDRFWMCDWMAGEPYGANGQPFNEIVVDAAGRAWVDMRGSMPWEEPKPGIVTVVLPDGSSRQVADDVWFPNGWSSWARTRSWSPSRTRTG